MAQDKYFVIFGGGGIRGLAYCGAYRALVENNVELTGFAGSSIGAVFAGLLSVGYTSDEIYELVSSVGFEMFIDINMNFKKEIGFSKGRIFYDWIKEKIEKKYYGEEYKKGAMPPVVFGDIEQKLIIYSVDITNAKFCEFSNTKTPDFEVAKAIRASVSMPGLFKPLEIDNKLLVDGDLLKCTPLWRVTNSIKNLDERILEFRLEDNQTTPKINTSLEYINRVYNSICGFATDYIMDLYQEKDKFDYIKIDTPNISVVDFLIPQEKRQELCDIGYQTTNNYFKINLPRKKTHLLEKYRELLIRFNRFQKDFNNKNFFNSYVSLCEVFMYLCNEKKYIDSKLYDEIIDFKDVYLENYNLKIDLFGFKKANLSNKEEVNKSLLCILKTISCKVDELKN